MSVGGPCREHNAPRVYVAAPIFTEDQLRAVGAVTEILEGCGYVTYSPSRDGIMLAPDDPAERRDEVFRSNVAAIRQSDLLVALLDVKDTGTTWELGLATGNELPIIAVTLSVPQMNVMLERGVVAHVRDLDALAGVARRLRPFLMYGRNCSETIRALEAFERIRLKETYSYSGKTQ